MERKVQNDEREIKRIKRFNRVRENKKIQRGKTQRGYIEQLTKQYDMQRLPISKLGTPIHNQQRETNTTQNIQGNNNVLLSRESGNSDQHGRGSIDKDALRSLRPTDQQGINPSQPQTESDHQTTAPQSSSLRSSVASGDLAPAPTPASSPAFGSSSARKSSTPSPKSSPPPTPTSSQEPKEKESHFVKFAKQYINEFKNNVEQMNINKARANLKDLIKFTNGFKNYTKTNPKEYNEDCKRILNHLNPSSARFAYSSKINLKQAIKEEVTDILKSKGIASNAVIDMGNMQLSDLEKIELASGRRLEKE